MSSKSAPPSNNIVPLHGLRRGEPVWETGGLVEKTKVTLRLMGDDLNPHEITQILGLEPTHAHRRGEPRAGPDFKAPYGSGAWLLTVEVLKPEGPNKATERLVDLLPNDPKLWIELASRYDLSISYGIFFQGWNRGFDLSHGLLLRLALFQARLEFDLYTDQRYPEGIKP